MSSGTFASILGQLKEFPAPFRINFSGYGEPMTHPSFWQFLAQAKQAGHHVEIITNGLLLDSAASEKLLDLGV
jgi:MoaA/NifB/PqqE/SkfB family radical SAM enzyme